MARLAGEAGRRAGQAVREWLRDGGALMPARLVRTGPGARGEAAVVRRPVSTDETEA